MKRFIVLLSFVVLLFVSSSCSKGEREYLTLYVASETRLAHYAMSVSETLVVRTNENDKWNYIYLCPQGCLKGFNFEQGYEYELRVLHVMKKTEDILMDDSADEYRLIRVVSKKKKNSENMPGHNCTREDMEYYCNYQGIYYFDKENSKVNYESRN